MDKIAMLHRIKEIYENNENVVEYLKKISSSDSNTIEDILISYDFQAGTYIKNYEAQKMVMKPYFDAISKTIDKLCIESNLKKANLCEVGVGEATTLTQVSKQLAIETIKYGFAISWSRIKYANQFVMKNDLKNVELVVGDLFATPLKDDSMDIVYTSHSIEPNGGREEEALRELYRITKRYLVLLEPGYRFASKQGKERMKRCGYVTSLYETAKKLGYNIKENREFDYSLNPLNPTELIVIEKPDTVGKVDLMDPWCCPITKATGVWNKKGDGGEFYIPDSMLLYPIVCNIPCLLPQNAIIATKYSI